MRGGDFIKSPNVRLGARTMAAALFLTACARGEQTPAATETKTVTVSATAAPSSTDQAQPFEARAGTVYRTDDPTGRKVGVRVYAGPKDSPEDKVQTGYFAEGQTVLALCKVMDGRKVFAEVSLPGLPPESTEWDKFQSAQGQPEQWAPAMYVNMRGVTLPNC